MKTRNDQAGQQMLQDIRKMIKKEERKAVKSEERWAETKDVESRKYCGGRADALTDLLYDLKKKFGVKP